MLERVRVRVKQLSHRTVNIIYLVCVFNSALIGNDKALYDIRLSDTSLVVTGRSFVRSFVRSG